MPRASIDSWVLVSVLLCGPKGGRLRDIIACGDYVNHAVFPFERLRDGLFALQKAGLISCEDGRYQASPRASRFWREARNRERGLFKAWGLLERWLDHQDRAEAVAGVRRIKKTGYDTAVRIYLDTF